MSQYQYKISVQVLLQYQSKSYYIIGQEVYYSIGQLLHYRAFFITLPGTYYSIGRLLHYRLVQPWPTLAFSDSINYDTFLISRPTSQCLFPLHIDSTPIGDRTVIQCCIRVIM